MSEDEHEIDGAAKRLGVSAAQVSRCDSTESAEIADAARSRFVSDSPRVWWLGFRQPFDSHPYSDSKNWERKLVELIPRGTNSCWLIVESDRSIYPVYKIQIDTILSVLRECSFFEYYLVSLNFDWIIADTDHNELIVARSS